MSYLKEGEDEVLAFWYYYTTLQYTIIKEDFNKFGLGLGLGFFSSESSLSDLLLLSPIDNDRYDGFGNTSATHGFFFFLLLAVNGLGLRALRLGENNTPCPGRC